MPLPLDDFTLATLCAEITTGPGEVCIVLPGSAQLCAQYGFETGDNAQILRSLLAQVNTALAPLQPFFNVLDFLQACLEVVQAIPGALGPPPDPTTLIRKTAALVEKFDKLLALFPPTSVPVMVRSILDAMIQFLLALRAELVHLMAQGERINAAELRAVALGNANLQLVVDCARANFDAQLVNMNASITPLRRLLGVVNTLLHLASLPCIEIPIGSIDGINDEALAILDAAISALLTAKAAISVPDFDFGPPPSPGDPC